MYHSKGWSTYCRPLVWQKHVCRRTQHPYPIFFGGYSTQFACRRSSRTKNGPRTAGEYSPAASIQDSQYSRPVTFGELKIVGAAASKDPISDLSAAGQAMPPSPTRCTAPARQGQQGGPESASRNSRAHCGDAHKRLIYRPEKL